MTTVSINQGPTETGNTIPKFGLFITSTQQQQQHHRTYLVGVRLPLLPLSDSVVVYTDDVDMDDIVVVVVADTVLESIAAVVASHKTRY